MKRQFIFVTLLFSLGALAFPVSYIQIKCEAGIRIFLDGDFKGISTADLGGFIIEDVSPGSHSIKAVKTDYEPQIQSVALRDGEVKIVVLPSFTKKVKVEEGDRISWNSLNPKMGTLVIQSVPVECRIEIPGCGIAADKNQDRWEVKEVPVGKYLAIVSSLSVRMEKWVEIKDGETTHIFANFLKSAITEIPTPTKQDLEKTLRPRNRRNTKQR